MTIPAEGTWTIGSGGAFGLLTPLAAAGPTVVVVAGMAPPGVPGGGDALALPTEPGSLKPWVLLFSSGPSKKLRLNSLPAPNDNSGSFDTSGVGTLPKPALSDWSTSKRLIVRCCTSDVVRAGTTITASPAANSLVHVALPADAPVVGWVQHPRVIARPRAPLDPRLSRLSCEEISWTDTLPLSRERKREEIRPIVTIVLLRQVGNVFFKRRTTFREFSENSFLGFASKLTDFVFIGQTFLDDD